MYVLRKLLSHLVNPRHRWGRLAALLIPFAVLGVWLKVLRVRAFYPESGILDWAAQLSSEVAFGLAWALLWVVLVSHGPGWWRSISFYLAHIATLILAVYQAMNHEYFIRTGAPLGWEQMEYAWRGQDELSGLLASEVSDSTNALITWAVVSTTLLPTILGPALSRLMNMRPSRLFKRLTAVALAGLFLASTWSAPTASASFVLAGPVRLVVGPVREASAYPSQPEQPVVLDPNTHLVAREGEEQRNLVVIMLESQRDSSTLPATKAPVTPVLDQLKHTSIAPERGYTVLPHTSKAITTTHCGIAPPADMTNSEAEPGGVPGKCLAALLREKGYATGFFQSATETFERRRDTVTNLGFESFVPLEAMDTTGFNSANYFGYEDDIMLGPERAWIQEHSKRPFMLSMLTVTAHHDYNLQGYTPTDFVDDPLLNRYLNGLHYQDRFVGKVIDMFKQMGLYEDTVFVITGDHGEGFGEHRLYQHDNTIYEEGVRIPLLIHDPRKEGKTIDGPANQLAILPTAVDALGYDLVTEGTYQPSLLSGQSQGPVVTTCHIRARCIATLDGDLKVIHHFGDRRDEVFNVAEDAYERSDIVTQTDGAWVAEKRRAALSWYVAWENAYAAAR